jgi:hypothetical protein
VAWLTREKTLAIDERSGIPCEASSLVLHDAIAELKRGRRSKRRRKGVESKTKRSA